MKWIKKIWSGFVKWFRGLFRKKYRSIKPSGSTSLLLGSSTGLEPQFEQHYRRSALAECFELIGKRNTEYILGIDPFGLDQTFQHEPTPEKRKPFIKKKGKVHTPEKGVSVRSVAFRVSMDTSGSMKVSKNRFGKI